MLRKQRLREHIAEVCGVHVGLSSNGRGARKHRIASIFTVIKGGQRGSAGTDRDEHDAGSETFLKIIGSNPGQLLLEFAWNRRAVMLAIKHLRYRHAHPHRGLPAALGFTPKVKRALEQDQPAKAWLEDEYRRSWRAKAEDAGSTGVNADRRFAKTRGFRGCSMAGLKSPHWDCRPVAMNRHR